MTTLRNLNDYQAPADVDEALKLLRRRKVITVPLGGGGDLVTGSKPEIQSVVDVQHLGLAYVRGNGHGDLEIGAATTLQTLVDDVSVGAYADGAVSQAARDTAARNMRASATLAGSIVTAPSNSPLLAVLLAVQAIVMEMSIREHEIRLSHYMPETGRLLTRVRLPQLPVGTRVAYEKVARTPADLPIVVAAAAYVPDGDRRHSVQLALGGIGPEMLLITEPSVTVDEAVELVMTLIDPPDDYFASGEYRRAMAGVLTRRVLSR